MGDTVSIWLDLRTMTGPATTGDEDSLGGFSPTAHHVTVGSIIIRNAYIGDLDKGSGKMPQMGFWEWMPKCVGEGSCSYPIPEKWQRAVRGGWHWGEVDKYKGDAYLALSKNKPRGKKIGAITDFSPTYFKNYNPKDVGQPRPWNTIGYWALNDGFINLSGTWEFVNLIKK